MTASDDDWSRVGYRLGDTFCRHPDAPVGKREATATPCPEHQPLAHARTGCADCGRTHGLPPGVSR